NRFVYTHEKNASSAPYLTVYLGGEKTNVGPGIGNLAVEWDRTARLPAGEAWIKWDTDPSEHGESVTLGFLVSIQRTPYDNDEALPRYLIPAAGRPGQSVEMHLRDLGLKPGASVIVDVRAVGRYGTIGVPESLGLSVS